VVATAKIDPENEVQTEEDILATACAVYAVLLGAHDRGLVGYWRTPAVLREDAGREALGIPADERFVALIQLGYGRQEKPARERTPADEVVSYLG